MPIGKGSRLIIVHAGSPDTGFVPQSELIFKASKSKRPEDYHCEMMYSVFKNGLPLSYCHTYAQIQ